MNNFLSLEEKTEVRGGDSATSLLNTDFFTEFGKQTLPTKFIISVIALINIIFMFLVISSLFIESSVTDIVDLFQNVNAIAAFKTTMISLSISALITILLGIPFSYYISKKNSFLNKIFNIFVTLPLLMPPSITGLALLLTFGRKGFLTSISSSIPFSFTALIIVQVFVMLPLFTQSMKNAFFSIDKSVVEAARVEGAVEKDILLKIYLPLSKRALSTGLIMAVLRGAGEFGATIMFAGNLSGRTQTLTTAIYSLSQTNLSQAIALAAMMISFFLIPLILVELKIK